MKTKMILERPKPERWSEVDTMAAILLCVVLAVVMACFGSCDVAHAEPWTVTAYDACLKCCLKTDGITASGIKAMPNHTVACNWLKFGSKVSIDGKVYTVEDRGAKSLFGSKKNHIKRIDVYFKTHKEAVKWGKRQCNVVILD